MANRNFLSNKLYQMNAYVVRLSAKFTVDATNGAGITGLSAPGIRSVFMHTSTTPSTGNPNPASGIIQVQLQDNYQALIHADARIQSPVTGGALTSTVANTTYQITALGTATTAQWVTRGLPIGVTPALGVAFVATSSGAIGGSAAVKALTNSGITSIERLGTPANAVNPAAPAAQGMYLLFQCLAAAGTATSSAPVLTMNSYTPAGTNDGGTPPLFTGTPATLTGSVSAPTITVTATETLAAPAAGSIITLDLFLSNSTVSAGV